MTDSKRPFSIGKRDIARSKASQSRVHALQHSLSETQIPTRPQNTSAAGITKPNIALTDSIQTALLWRRVLRRRLSNERIPFYRKPTAASPKTASNRQHSLAADTSSMSPRRLSTPDDGASTPLTVGPSKVRLALKDFRARVFKGYGIQLKVASYLESPYTHFGTDPPSTYLDASSLDGLSEAEVTQWYQKTHKDCNIWLSLNTNDAKVVAQQYANMNAIGSNEAKFSHRGKLYFFREDMIYAPSDVSRCSSSYCELEWAPVPDKLLLARPPLLDSSGEAFAFDSKPDCTYWLTIRRMNSRYRAEISKYTFVLPGARAASPYLTIEFKKSRTDFNDALNQLAVATTLALYNRFCLRCQRLQTRDTRREDWRFEDIKHYGIALNGSEARLYLARPILSTEATATAPDELWQGCKFTEFRTFDVDTLDGVLDIRAWTNEIHNWGLGQHSIQFQADIKGILSGQNESEVVSFNSDERAALG